MTRDLTECVALLLSKRSLREEFAKDAKACARLLRLKPRYQDDFLKLCSVQLGRQGELLIRKRFHEIKPHLPKFLRNRRDLYPLFLEHAERFWPRGYRRHHLDAHRFTLFCILRFFNPRRILRTNLSTGRSVTQQ